MTAHVFKKQFGQNFLKYASDSAKLVDSLDPSLEDYVFEIGPGDGRVTQILLRTVKEVIAVEIDSNLVTLLKEKFKADPSFEVIHKDILQIDLRKELDSRAIKGYKVIGSLPYNISKKIIQNFTEAELKPVRMSVILQKEVAQDYAAQPPKSSFLHHYVSALYHVKYAGTIKKDRFYPEPRVDGGILNFELRETPYIPYTDIRNYAKFLKNAYSSPRKKLQKVLSNIYKEINWSQIFQDLDIEENLRPAQLDTEQFVALWQQSMC